MIARMFAVSALLLCASAWSKPPSKKGGCPGGDFEACFKEGMKAVGTGDEVKAAKLLEKACTGGFFRACGPLGTMHAQGHGGLPVNLTKAYELYASACEARSAGGCVYLGRALLNGHGVKQDVALGLEKMQTGCELGEGEGCYLLGTSTNTESSASPSTSRRHSTGTRRRSTPKQRAASSDSARCICSVGASR